MKNINFFILSLTLVIFCAKTDETNYRNDIYKTYVNNSSITDLGMIPFADSQISVPIVNTAWSNSNKLNIEKIENYSEFKIAYGNYQDSLGIDSSFFEGNQIIGFCIIEIAGEIERYTYRTEKDTLALNCRFKINPERENGTLVSKTLKSCVITLGIKK